MSLLTMFKEKEGSVMDWSMTRVVAFVFAICYNIAMLLYAAGEKEISWPFAVLGAIVVLAVPLQAIAKYLQKWITTREGSRILNDLAKKALERAGVSEPVANVTVTQETADA